MGRRRQKDGGLIDAILDLSSQVPAAGLILGAAFAAGGVYLTWVAPQTMQGVGRLYGFICLLLAVLCGGAGVVGYLRGRTDRSARNSRLEGVQTLEDLRALDWRHFEQLVADAYRRHGYRVREVGGDGTGDGGVDLILERGHGLDHLVQCKQYRVWKVGEPKVREFYGAMAAHRTRCEGIIITSGRFTDPARQFAEGKPIKLIDGEALLRLLSSSNPIAPAVTTHMPVPSPATSTSPPQKPAPACPTCSAPMRLRTASRGQHTGKPFWGCSNFPRCKHTLPA